MQSRNFLYRRYTGKGKEETGMFANFIRLCKRYRFLPYVLLAIFLFIVYLWWGSLMAHGSFSPVVPLFTMSNGPASIDYSKLPPSNWKPSVRVVASVTTMPADVHRIDEMINSLLKQTLLPDAIYVNLPKKNGRTGKPYPIPEWLPKMPRVKILEPDVDYGPMTKLVPALEAEDDPDTIIITVDDDKVYAPDTFRDLVWLSEQEPDVALGMCGWSFVWVPGQMRVVSGYASWWTRGRHGLRVDVLQAACGNLYRRKFFSQLDVLKKQHKACFKADDMWISGYLAVKEQVPRILTPGPINGFFVKEPKDTSWLANNRNDRLSDDSIGKDWGCIQGVEESLGPWLAIRQTNQ